jgi:hypothetical protein
MRYVLGPSIDFAPAVVPDPIAVLTGKEDILPAMAWDQTSRALSLSIPAFNPESQQTPTEARLYAIPEGAPEFGDVASLVVSPFPFSIRSLPVDPAGAPGLAIELPAYPDTPRYVGRFVYGFPD